MYPSTWKSVKVWRSIWRKKTTEYCRTNTGWTIAKVNLSFQRKIEPFRMEVLNIRVSGQNYGVLVKTKVFVSKKQNHIFGQIVGVAQTWTGSDQSPNIWWCQFQIFGAAKTWIGSWQIFGESKYLLRPKLGLTNVQWKSLPDVPSSHHCAKPLVSRG